MELRTTTLDADDRRATEKANSRPRRLLRAAVVTGVVAASLSLGNLYSFKTSELPDGSRLLTHGWPMIYLVRWPNSYDPASQRYVQTNRWPVSTGPDDPIVAKRLPLLVNVATSLTILGCTWSITFWSAGHTSFPRRFTLRDMFVAVGLFAVYFVVGRVGSLEVIPLLTWKPLVFFPILLGMVCVALVVAATLSRIMRATGHFWSRSPPS
jgi:hypothetical protein